MVRGVAKRGAWPPLRSAAGSGAARSGGSGGGGSGFPPPSTPPCRGAGRSSAGRPGRLWRRDDPLLLGQRRHLAGSHRPAVSSTRGWGGSPVESPVPVPSSCPRFVPAPCPHHHHPPLRPRLSEQTFRFPAAAARPGAFPPPPLGARRGSFRGALSPGVLSTKPLSTGVPAPNRLLYPVCCPVAVLRAALRRGTGLWGCFGGVFREQTARSGPA